MAAATVLMLAALAARRGSPAGIVARPLGGATDWNGWIAGVPDGTYAFSASEPGTQLAIDGRIVFDGRTAVPVRLDSTPRAFDFERRDAQGGFDVQWSRDGAPPEPVPSAVLFARRPRPITVTIASLLERFVAATEWLWVLTLTAAVAAVALAVWSRRRESIASLVNWPALRWVLLASFVLNAIPVWWGLPAIWPPDEVTHATVMRAFAEHFSHGWFDRWPPLHYYVLTLAVAPAIVLDALGRVDLGTVEWSAAAALIGRIVSLAAAAGTLIAVAIVASQIFGRRAGVLSVATYALAAPFPYYAKTANMDVPYVFWFAVSLVFYLRLLDTTRTRDAMAFAACATLAVCTKDQAYALYPLMAVAIAIRVLQARRRAGLPAWRVLFDARILAGVATAVVVFAACYNLLFNWSGFVEHVRYLLGPGSETYRMFPRTFEGRLALLRLTGDLLKNSWGWPMTIVCGIGVVTALGTRRLRVPAVLLLAPPVAYYLTFVNVILYDYDRFVLPMTLVLAMFGGFALDRLLSWARVPRLARLATVGTLFAYTVLYAATLDALMLRDSRIVVGRWAANRLRPGEQVAVSGPHELEPSFSVPWSDVSTRADLERAKPAYYVLSADYARAVPTDTEWGQLIGALRSGAAGYRLVARVRCASPWPWLPGGHPELVGPRPVEAGGSASSVLRDINPTLEIYARGNRPREALACAATLLP